jgi:hypothetical protein
MSVKDADLIAEFLRSQLQRQDAEIKRLKEHTERMRNELRKLTDDKGLLPPSVLNVLWIFFSR